MKPARGKLNRKNAFFPVSPFAPENLVSRDGFGRVPSRVSLLISILRLNLVLTCGILPAPASIRRYRHPPPSSQSRVHRVTTQLRTDGVDCRESAGTGPVVLKVVPGKTGAAYSGILMDHFLYLSFPAPPS